jgi:hypothetical protein
LSSRERWGTYQEEYVWTLVYMTTDLSPQSKALEGS